MKQLCPVLRLVLAFCLLCLATLATIVLANIGILPWKIQGMRYMNLRHWMQWDTSTAAANIPARRINMSAIQADNANSLVPLDVDSLRENLPKLKQAAKQHASRRMLSRNVDRLIAEYVPTMDTRNWSLHSTSGRQFTVRQLQQDFLANMQPGFVVPNVAHIILPFFDNHLKFYHMVGILSCIHVMRPHRLMLWYAPGRLPTGEWWDRLRRNLTYAEWDQKIIMAQRPIPKWIYAEPVQVREHQSDVMRMEALLIFGGFYMDLDVFVLKPLEPLRKFPCSIGREVSYGLCNGAFLSAPNGTFLAMWYTAYQVFDDADWGDHSVQLPHTMQKLFPNLCHVEEESMDRPNWTPEEVQWIYAPGQQNKWDWRAKNYVMHLWFDKYGKHDTMESIRTVNSTYGEMCRFILFGH